MLSLLGEIPAFHDDSTIRLFGADGVSSSTKELVDTEVRRILDECYAEAADTLRRHRAQLDGLASVLLERGNLDAAEDQLLRALAILEPLEFWRDEAIVVFGQQFGGTLRSCVLFLYLRKLLLKLCIERLLGLVEHFDGL